MKKVVILLNMGGPESLDDVKVFLSNMFNDKYILPMKSKLLRSFVAWIITKMRDKEAQENYKALGGKSPLADTTRSLVAKLNALSGEYHFDFAMNYVSPFANEVLARYKDCDEMVFFPLYPHHSQTTVTSSLDSAFEAAKKYGIQNIRVIEPFYDDANFNEILINDIKQTARKMAGSDDFSDINMIFSAHSLPLSIIEKGDLYEKHINAHAKLLGENLGFKSTCVAYQSRLGPVKWLEPNISAVLDDLKGQKALVYPISFCIDCSESDFELNILFREHAKNAGVSEYDVVKAPNDSQSFAKYILEKCQK